MNDELLNDFLLEAFPNPERKGCPDDDALKAFAEKRTPPGNPILQHISSCSECYREYRHYRQDWLESGGQKQGNAAFERDTEPIQFPGKKNPQSVPVRSNLLWALAAGVAVVVGTGTYFVTARHHIAPASGALIAPSSTPVKADVNLFSAVTARGGGDEPTPLKQVTLPSSIVRLAVTLPRFSQSGPYEVLVSKDRAGKDIVARGTGGAVESSGKTSLSVDLDLRNAAPGSYFLATVRGSDNGTYYYPLQVR